MSLISIIGTPLYQWETGRKLKIIPLRGMRVDSVHISNYGDKTALVVKPREENGAYIADIPNILLQDDRSIAVYSVNISENKTETLRECVFSIRKRAKPSDYIYTETEVFTYKALEERMARIEENGIGEEQIAEAVKGYLEQNPIRESDPSVPEWAKQPQKPKYTASDVGALSKDELQNGVNLALQQAKESGAFDGKPGNDYILTEEDKQEIADMIPSASFSVKAFGAVGDGVADDTGAIQAALDASHASGGGTVIIPTGTYLLSDALKFYSNQHIAGEPGSVLLQKDGNIGGAYGNLMRNYYNGSGGYDATGNVIIEGLTFDGGTQETSPATLLAFCHSRNIEVRGCTFINGYSDSNTVGNGHDIEVNSTHNVKISNCTFSNNRRIGYFSELVQIDTAVSSEVYPWEPDEGERCDDGTASDTVILDGCIFEGSHRETLAQRSVFVGSHSTQKNKNILIRDCRMIYSSYAVRFADVEGLVVRDNIIGDVGVGIYVEKSDTGTLAIGNTFVGEVQTPYPKRVIGHGNMRNGVHIEEPEIGGNGIEVSGAEVGQFLRVAEVDENGVPTAWETVDAPTGGGNKKWELIGEIVLEQEVNKLSIDISSYDGDEIMILIVSVGTATNATAAGNITVGAWGIGVIGSNNAGAQKEGIINSMIARCQRLPDRVVAAVFNYNFDLRTTSYWHAQGTTNSTKIGTPNGKTVAVSSYDKYYGVGSVMKVWGAK